MSKKIVLTLCGFLLLGGIWEFCAQTRPGLLFVLPAPSAIFATLIEMRHRFAFHTLCTLKEMLGGFVLALTIAFPLAWMMMRYHTTRTLLQPLFILIQCVPMFTLAPLMVIWFGWNYIAIVIPTALMIFFPLTLNIYQGLRSTPQDLLEFFHANQATATQRFFKLHLPWAVPHIFAGFRISSAIAGVGAVAGEWAGAQAGLGMLMLESRRNTDLEVTFGALACLTAMSTLLYGIILLAEKIALPPRPFKWKKSLALFPLLLLVSCQPKAHEKTRLLLDWIPNPNHVPLYTGVEKGFFQEEGIDLVIQKMHDNGGGLSYLTSHQADLLVYHMPGTLKACARGAQVKLIGVLINEPLGGFICREGTTLNGSTLGYCIGGPDTSFLDFLLDQGEIEPGKRKNVSVDLISAMGTGAVDFIYGGFWNIEPAQLLSMGVATETIPLQELGVPHYYEMIILSNADTPESAPDFVHAFQRALQKSLDFCQAHPDEAFACYQKHNPDKREKTLAWERDAWARTVPTLATSQEVDVQVIKTFADWLAEQKIVSKSFDPHDLVR